MKTGCVFHSKCGTVLHIITRVIEISHLSYEKAAKVNLYELQYKLMLWYICCLSLSCVYFR